MKLLGFKFLALFAAVGGLILTPVHSNAAKAKAQRECFEVLRESGKLEVETAYDVRGNPVGFYVYDKVSDPHSIDMFKLLSHLENGVLKFHLRTVFHTGHRSKFMRGAEIFEQMMKFYGAHVKMIQVQWDYGSNLKDFNKLTKFGLSLEEAALLTWTGQQADKFGFDQVKILDAWNKTDTGKIVDYHFVVGLLYKKENPPPKNFKYRKW